MGFLVNVHLKTLVLSVILTCRFSSIQSQISDQKYISLNEAISIMQNNNPYAKNARLQVELSEANKNNTLEIYPTEFTYHYGQLTSTVNDKYFEVNQNFGSPLAHYYKGQINKEDLKYAKTQTADCPMTIIDHPDRRG